MRTSPRTPWGRGAFNANCRFWDDPRLLRDDALAAQLADRLGDAPSLVMRANGAVTVGPSIELAAGFAWCLEDAARIETLVRSVASDASVEAACLTGGEIASRQVSSGAVFERLWEYLTAGDTEAKANEGGFPDPVWGTAS